MKSVKWQALCRFFYYEGATGHGGSWVVVEVMVFNLSHRIPTGLIKLMNRWGQQKTVYGVRRTCLEATHVTLKHVLYTIVVLA